MLVKLYAILLGTITVSFARTQACRPPRANTCMHTHTRTHPQVHLNHVNNMYS